MPVETGGRIWRGGGSGRESIYTDKKQKKRGKRGEVKLFDSRIAVIIEMLENASIGVSVDFAQTLHGCHCIV